MPKIDYYKLTEITVKSQEEFDMIPDDFKGRIYVEFGTVWAKAVVNRRFYRSVEARGNSSVEAWENSSVVARGNSSVVARGNSSVVANGNSQIVDCQINGRIEISGNARIVFMPKTIHEFMDYYGIKHTKKRAKFFKAVHRVGELYVSDYNREFEYKIGATVKENCDTNVDVDCSSGIHIAHMAWALDFGKEWDDLAILEVETDIDSIIMPTGTNGKVRTSKVKVLREVPLEDCGVYGKILAKRRQQN